MAKIVESGIIGTDGKLRLPMDRVQPFFAGQRGKRVIATFETFVHDASETQKAYYYNYVVPTISVAMRGQGKRMTEKGIDEYLIAEYPGDLTKDGECLEHARELNEEQMFDFLEWLKQFAAENFQTYVEDPKTI